jgi:succinyl-CoA synthetase alpha subunit
LTTVGEHLGLPLLPDLRKAKEQLKPDATAVFVAAPHCGKAIEDAIEAEIPLIVAVAEHIPLHDILRVGLRMLRHIIHQFADRPR